MQQCQNCHATCPLSICFHCIMQCLEINPEYPLEGLMLKLKLLIFWPPDLKHWLIGKDPDAGKDWRLEEKQITEDDMVGWHHRLDGDESEQTLRVGDGRGSLTCCSPWSCRVRHDWATELNWSHTIPDWEHCSKWNTLNCDSCYLQSSREEL